MGPAWGTYAACHTRRHGRDDARDGLCEGHVRDAGGAAAKAGAASDMVRVRRRYDDPNCNETATHVSKRRFVRGVPIASFAPSVKTWVPTIANGSHARHLHTTPRLVVRVDDPRFFSAVRGRDSDGVDDQVDDQVDDILRSAVAQHGLGRGVWKKIA